MREELLRWKGRKEGETEREGESKGKQEARTQDGPGKARRGELGKEEPGQAFRPLAVG